MVKVKHQAFACLADGLNQYSADRCKPSDPPAKRFDAITTNTENLISLT